MLAGKPARVAEYLLPVVLICSDFHAAIYLTRRVLLVFAEATQITPAIKQELQKADVFAPQCLSNAEENKVLLETGFGRRAANNSS